MTSTDRTDPTRSLRRPATPVHRHRRPSTTDHRPFRPTVRRRRARIHRSRCRTPSRRRTTRVSLTDHRRRRWAISTCRAITGDAMTIRTIAARRTIIGADRRWARRATTRGTIGRTASGSGILEIGAATTTGMRRIGATSDRPRPRRTIGRRRRSDHGWTTSVIVTIATSASGMPPLPLILVARAHSSDHAMDRPGPARPTRDGADGHGHGRRIVGRTTRARRIAIASTTTDGGHGGADRTSAARSERRSRDIRTGRRRGRATRV